MKTMAIIVGAVLLGSLALATAQPPAQPGGMGAGTMVDMRHQMTGMMQQMGDMMARGQMSPEQLTRMGELMKEMGAMMGGMGAMGGGMGPATMSEMPKMMERMADMQSACRP
jgi:hypothetical protein